jgi:hypothetical protein
VIETITGCRNRNRGSILSKTRVSAFRTNDDGINILFAVDRIIACSPMQRIIAPAAEEFVFF